MQINAQQRQKDRQNEGMVNLRITDDDKPQKKKKKTKEKREKQQDAEFAAFDYSQADKNIFLGMCYKKPFQCISLINLSIQILII